VTWLVRRGTVEEVDAVLAFWRTTTVESTTDDAAALVGLLARDPDSLFLAIADAGAIVGTLITGWDGWRGGLYRLAVAPDARLAGVGTALVRAGEDRLRGLGARRISAIVIDDHDHAVGFWRAAGYERNDGVGRFVRQL
jgi:ribosomal protein S18 acetylase RimI-like enzyme